MKPYIELEKKTNGVDLEGNESPGSDVANVYDHPVDPVEPTKPAELPAVVPAALRYEHTYRAERVLRLRAQANVARLQAAKLQQEAAELDKAAQAESLNATAAAARIREACAIKDGESWDGETGEITRLRP